MGARPISQSSGSGGDTVESRQVTEYPSHKTCPRCDHEFNYPKEPPEAHFYKNASRRDGLSQWCTTCTAAYVKTLAARGISGDHDCRMQKFKLDEASGIYVCPVCGLPYSATAKLSTATLISVVMVDEAIEWRPWKPHSPLPLKRSPVTDPIRKLNRPKRPRRLKWVRRLIKSTFDYVWELVED